MQRVLERPNQPPNLVSLPRGHVSEIPEGFKRFFQSVFGYLPFRFLKRVHKEPGTLDRPLYGIPCLLWRAGPFAFSNTRVYGSLCKR
eukprot:3057119-Prymnesium_polylepis.1